MDTDEHADWWRLRQAAVASGDDAVPYHDNLVGSPARTVGGLAAQAALLCALLGGDGRPADDIAILAGGLADGLALLARVADFVS